MEDVYQDMFLVVTSKGMNGKIVEAQSSTAAVKVGLNDMHFKLDDLQNQEVLVYKLPAGEKFMVNTDLTVTRA